MSLKLTKILRNISKGILFLTGLGLLGYVGYLTYLSLEYSPYRVTISNITDSSVTVSWVTDIPTKGYVYYKEKDSFLPGPLGWFRSEIAYDDRDWAKNQSICVNEFNQKVELDNNYTVVDSSNFDCENIQIDEVGDFLTHHVTLRNLEESKEYYFRVGNGFWSWSPKVPSIKTFSLLEEVGEPTPVFGKIVLFEGVAADDSIIFGQFNNVEEKKESILYSSVTNRDGGWYLDAGNVRADNGEVFKMNSGEDMFYVTGQFRNMPLSEVKKWVYGSFDGSYPDIEVGEVLKSRIQDNVLGESVEPNEQGGKVLGLGDNILNIVKSILPPKPLTPPPPAPVVTTVQERQLTAEEKRAISVANDAARWTAIAARETGSEDLKKEADNLVKIVSDIRQGKDSEDMVKYFTDPNATEDVKSKVKSVIYADNKEGGTGGLTNQGVEDFLGDHLDKVEKKGELDEKSLREELCPSCSTFVSSKIIKEILNDPTKAAQYVNDIGPGNVSRIFIAAGVDIDKTVLEDYMGLNYNAGNLNSLSILQGGDKNGAITQQELDEAGDVYAISAKGTGRKDALGREILEWQTPFQRTIIPNPLLNPGLNPAKITYIGKVSGEVENGEEVKREISREERVVNGLIFSNAAFNIPLEITKEGLVIKTYDTGYEPPSLSYNTETGSYEIADMKGLTQYVMASVFETAASLGPDVVSAALKKVPIIRLQSPIKVAFDSITEEKPAEGVTETLIPVSLQSPLVLKNPENTIVLGSIIKLNEGIADLQRKAEEAVLSSVCIHNGAGAISRDCETKGIKLRLIEANDSSGDSLLDKLQSNVYAAELTEGSDFLIYSSEDGIIDISSNGVKVASDIESSANEVVMLYIESNGVEGYQIPKDWKNPGKNDDKIISTKSVEIKIDKKSAPAEFNLKKGINIISFDKVLVGEGMKTLTAHGLLSKYPEDIQFVASYSNGRWSNIASSNEGSFSGADFDLSPGKGYLILARYDRVITLPSYALRSSVPIYFSSGWNLVGMHGYSKAFTARTLLDSINALDSISADNVSWWPTAKGRYEGLQVVDGKEYGLDFPISPSNGYFIRITDFKPEAEECKSVIWQPDGSSHGLCGNGIPILN